MIWFLAALSLLLVTAVTMGSLVIVDALVWERRRWRRMVREEQMRILREKLPLTVQAMRSANASIAEFGTAMQRTADALAALAPLLQRDSK